MTEVLNPDQLRAKAAPYRAMVRLAYDERVIKALLELADEYEATADRLEKSYPGRDRNRSAEADDS